MAEQQAPTPQDGASQEPASDFDSKLDGLLFGESTDKEQDAQQPTDEATDADADALGLIEAEPEGEPQASPEEFDLIHNGQNVRVSKEQARNLAQMGYDYSSKMQALNADKGRVQQVANALQAQAAVQAQLLDHASVVKAFDMQLAQYQGADWVRLSQDDPIGYSQARAQYDALMERRNAAVANFANAHAQYKQASGFVSAEVRALEQQKLLERIPEWRDPQKYGREAKEVYDHAIGYYGLNPQELADSQILEDHRAIAILRDAMKYRRAVEASRAKQKGQVPQSARPGALPERRGADNTAVLQKQLRQSKDRGAKNKAFDALLDKKLFG